jgi:hypothetical protein
MNRQATAVTIAVAVVAPLACGLAVLGGIGSFATVRHLAAPWFGSLAWIVPVGIDIGILALLAWDLVSEYLNIPWPVLRWIAWAFIAGTVYLNVTAADGNPTAALMHAAMPVLFITVIEGIRHLIRQATGLATGTRIERIPATRWALAPWSSYLLFRQMILWHVTSYTHGLALEQQRQRAIARLQQAYGRYLWRWRAPLSDRLILRLGSSGDEIDTTSVITTVTQASRSADILMMLPRRCRLEPPQIAAKRMSEADQRLVNRARAIVQDAKQQGRRLSQTALAREMRAQGQPIANDRLRWLIRAAEGDTTEVTSTAARGQP